MDNRTFFHLAAFRGSVTNGTTNTAIAGVPDSILARSAANNFLSPPDTTIRAGIAGGVNASRARIDTPNVRQVGLPYIAPLQTGITVQSPPNIADFGIRGPRPAAADEIAVQSTHTDVAAQIQFALLWLAFNRREWTPGDKYRVRGTAAIAGVVGAWANGAITLDQNLPAGIYQIQGMDLFGTNLIAGRLLFVGGGWRPGVLARNAVASVPDPLGTDGRLGVFGEFDTVAIPQLEIYVEAANSAQEVYLDIVRIGNR